jgi:hypothetical protein
MLSGRLVERPELASLLFLAGFLTVLARAPERPRLLWLLPAQQVLWVNCHGFFVLGPLVLAAYWVELAAARVWRTAVPVACPPLKILVPATVATLLACGVNPYGWDAIGLPLEQFGKLGSAGIYRSNIGELKTVGDFLAVAGLWNPYLLAFAVVLGLGLASFVLLGRRGRVHPFRALIFVAAAYLGWQATRNSALFAVVAAFVIPWNLDEATALATTATMATTRKVSRRSRRRRSAKAARDPHFVPLVGIGALALATLSGALYRWAGEGRTVGFGERENWYAHGACAFLARADVPERMIAFNLGQAAVCIAHTAPAHKQFMDPRLEVNTQETFERYLDGFRQLWRDVAGWEVPLGIDYTRPDEMPALLIERGPVGRAANNLVRDPRWRLVYTDDVAAVFVGTAFAEKHGLPAVP